MAQVVSAPDQIFARSSLINMAKAFAVFTAFAVADAASCSADDQAAIQAMDDSAFGISSACSECYAVTADYGFKNCKAACLLGWCKQGCLDCTAPAQVDLPACTGIPAGSPTPCMETVV